MSLEVMLTREEEENLRRRHNIGQRVKAGVMTAAATLGILAGVMTYKPSKALALGDELPKVEASSPSWYLLQNQPLEAIIKDIQKTDIRLDIGKTLATINSENYTLDAAPYIKNSRTMVPVRFITEGLGASVGWEGTEKKVMINYEGKTIELWIGKTNAKVDGSQYTLDAAPEIKNSRTFVPIRFIAENFGSQVGWDGTIKEVSIYKEKISQSINLNSDADKDGLSFSKEKATGTNPNNKNTVYNSLDDKKLSELLTQYPGLNIFAKYPDSKTGLTLPDKAMLNLDPRNPFNMDSVLNDEQAINYAKTKNLADNKDNIVKAVNLITENYGPKLGKALKLTASETNENIFKITVEELDDQGNIAKQQMDEMWNERAYKTKADNTALTLDDLTSIDRFKAIILLNKTFGAEQINVMLSQSPVLQQTQDFCLAYFRTQYEDFVKTLYDASNSTELSLNKKVKDTNTFKKYVNQLGLYDYNAGELAVQMWKNADDALKAEIKANPTLFLAMIGYSKILDIGTVILDGQEYNFATKDSVEKLANVCQKVFDFYSKTEQQYKTLKKGPFAVADQNISENGLKAYELNRLQNFVTIFASDIIEGRYEKKLREGGVANVINQLDIADYMNQLKEISLAKACEKVVQINGKSRMIDFTNPEISAASISLFVLPYNSGIVNPPENYGKIFSEIKTDTGNTIKDLLPDVIAYLSTGKIPATKIGVTELQMVDLERVIALSASLTEHYNGLYVSSVSGRIVGDSFFLTKRMNDGIRAAWGKLFNNMNSNFIEQKFPENTLSGPNVFRLVCYGDFFDESNLQGKSKENIFEVLRISQIKIGEKNTLEKIAPTIVDYTGKLYLDFNVLDSKIENVGNISDLSADGFETVAKTNLMWIKN